MSVNSISYQNIQKQLLTANVTLVAVSKTKPNEDIMELYELGHRDFGENYVQELLEKQLSLPTDIRWHFIGHLQSNKVKQLVPFIHLIHGVDSLKLLREINKQASKIDRTIGCLLQVHIAQEETKFGMDEVELNEAITASSELKNVNIEGLMGMASFSDDQSKVRSEFQKLRTLFEQYIRKDKVAGILSMGMSGDYQLAIEEGSTMVRIGSLIFGERSYPTN